MVRNDCVDMEVGRTKTVWDHHMVIEQCSSSISKYRVCFDKLNKYVFCCVAKTVNVYNTENGELLHELRHDSEVVAAHLNPQNSLQLLTCTVDGELALWNYEECTQIKIWNLDCAVCTFFVCKRPDVVGFVTGSKLGDTCSLYEVARKQDELFLRNPISGVPRDFRSVDCGCRAEYAAFVDAYQLHVYSLMNDEKANFDCPRGRTFVCVRCHPSEYCIATADNHGAITLWYNFFGKRPVTANFHWHSNPVADIAFPTEGSTMYSGGLECVAVKWCLQSSYKEETKEFLSRLGSHVSSLSTSPDNKLLAIVLADNRIHVVSSQMQIVCTIKSFLTYGWIVNRETQKNNRHLCPLGLRYFSKGARFMSGLKNGCLLANGQPGYLQFYDPVQDRQVYSLDVIGRNLPPQEALTYSDVIHVDSIGPWLVTVEYREDLVYTGDLALKFWKFDEISQKFDVNLTVENPHFKIITSVRFQPTAKRRRDFDDGLILATSSLDGKVKFWSLDEQEDAKGRRRNTWFCESFACYRNKPAHLCQFNPGGKVLAVNFGNLLTFWKFDDLRLLLSLPVVEEDDFLKSMEFGSRKGVAKLVCLFSDKGYCSVWDVDSQVKLWTFDCQLSCVCLHPASGILVGFTRSTAYYFELLSGSLLTSVDVTENKESNGILAACFFDEIPARGVEESVSNSGVNQMDFDAACAPPVYFLTEDQRIMRLCAEYQLNLYCQKETKTSIPSKKHTHLAALLEEAKASVVQKSVDPVDARFLEQRANLEVLNAPSHTLPGLEILGRNFIDSCLQPKVLNSDSRLADSIKEIETEDSRNITKKALTADVSLEKKGRKLSKGLNLSPLNDYFSKL